MRRGLAALLLALLAAAAAQAAAPPPAPGTVVARSGPCTLTEQRLQEGLAFAQLFAAAEFAPDDVARLRQGLIADFKAHPADESHGDA